MEDFKEFRNNEKSAYKTFKIPLKTILLNRDTTQPVINHLVFEMNDLVIHTYQFIRLYVLDKYNKNQTVFWPKKAGFIPLFFASLGVW